MILNKTTKMLHLILLFYTFLYFFRNSLLENKICTIEKKNLQQEIDNIKLYIYLKNISIDKNIFSVQSKF
jgi:hypothetical protein